MTRTTRFALTALLLLSAFPASAPADTTPFALTNGDAPGYGLTDPSPATYAPGNPGRTRGEQRQRVIEHAFALLGAWIASPQVIRTTVYFGYASCDPTDIGRGYALSHLGYVWSPPPPGVEAGRLYPGPLLEALTDQDLSPDTPDLILELNAQPDNPVCRGEPWYYGLDPTQPVPRGRRALLPYVLHELLHALGVSTLACVEPAGCWDARYGNFTLIGVPSVYDMHLVEARTNRALVTLSLAERQAAIAAGAVYFSGTRTLQALGALRWAPRALQVRTGAPGALAHFDDAGVLSAPRPDDVSGDLGLAPAVLHDLGWPAPATLPPRGDTPVAHASADTIFGDTFDTTGG